MTEGFPVYNQSIIFDDGRPVIRRELEGVYSTLRKAEEYVDDLAIQAKEMRTFVRGISNPNVYGFYNEVDAGLWMYYIGTKCEVVE